MKCMVNKARGFTIVELLIVIVIIAILAAITLVSYNGITARAEQSANFAAVKNYTQVLQMLKADTGSLPVSNSCLGPTGAYSSGSCAYAGQSGTVNTTTNNQLAAYGMSASQQPAIKINGKQAVVLYAPSFYGEPVLLYQVSASQDCVPSGSRLYREDPKAWVDGSTDSVRNKGGDNLTRCYLSLRDL